MDFLLVVFHFGVPNSQRSSFHGCRHCALHLTLHLTVPIAERAKGHLPCHGGGRVLPLLVPEVQALPSWQVSGHPAACASAQSPQVCDTRCGVLQRLAELGAGVAAQTK